MTTYRFGEIVLIEFLHSDLRTMKKRPALVILDIGDDDVILAPITSQTRESQGDCKIDNWSECGLVKESSVRLAKIACFGKSQIKRQLGQLASIDEKSVTEAWQQLYCQ